MEIIIMLPKLCEFVPQKKFETNNWTKTDGDIKAEQKKIAQQNEKLS